MKWLGLVFGLVLGISIGKFEAAFSLAVIGFVVGLILDVRAAGDKGTEETRFKALEKRIEELSARLAVVEGRGAVTPAEAGVRFESEPQPALPVEAEPMVSPAPLDDIVAVEPTLTPTLSQGRGSPPREPSPPNPIIAWLTGGNAIARVGVLILFFGLAFLLKYAVDRDMVPPELRVGGVAIVGIAMLIAGWKLRERKWGYAVGLQGGGVAVLYLTTFAALRLYHLVPPALAFGLLAAIAVFAAILAIAEDALVLAAFGTGGGFLAPILASSGGGSHVALFSYYLLLNIGIAIVALRKSWRSLNLMGFAFTFFIGLAWGYKFYQPEYLPTVEPFLIAFFVLYVAIAVLHAAKQGTNLKNAMDATIVFGAPLAAFGLQAALMKGTEFGLAFSCVGAGALYLILAQVLRRTQPEKYEQIFESFLALGVVFATLAIPFALDARWTSALWALEGAAVVWIGLRQGRRLATGFGLALQLAAGVAFFEGHRHLAAGDIPWLDVRFLGAVLIAIAGLISARKLTRPTEVPFAKYLAAPAFVWGILWWLFAGFKEVDALLDNNYRLAGYVGLVAATSIVFSYIARRIDWKHATWPSLGLTPALWLLFVLAILSKSHPFAWAGWAGWIFAVVALVLALYRHEEDASPRYRSAMHIWAVLLMVGIAAVELHWNAGVYTERHTAWTIAAVAVAPALALLAIGSTFADARWPIVDNAHTYRVSIGVILSALLIAWVFVSNFSHEGDSDPLPYIPLLNALDLAHILVVLAIGTLVMSWKRTYRGQTTVAPPEDWLVPGAIIASIAAFVWANGILLRSLHFYADIPYDHYNLTHSVLVQASLSVFWSVLALVLMLLAARHARRTLWVVGAGLMGVVVAKLFLLDLQHVTGIERVVSFIAVGVLMLVVGYLAPVPPRAMEAKP